MKLHAFPELVMGEPLTSFYKMLQIKMLSHDLTTQTLNRKIGMNVGYEEG
jgi:hypothetical protein